MVKGGVFGEETLFLFASGEGIFGVASREPTVDEVKSFKSIQIFQILRPTHNIRPFGRADGYKIRPYSNTNS